MRRVKTIVLSVMVCTNIGIWAGWAGQAEKQYAWEGAKVLIYLRGEATAEQEALWGVSASGEQEARRLGARTGLKDFDALGEQFGLLWIEQTYGDQQLYGLHFPLGKSVETIVVAYARLPFIEWASPGRIPVVLCATPNDPYFSSQWAHDTLHLQSEAAWNITKGSPNVPIAIIDTGMDYKHEDLQGNLWINTPEDRNGNGTFEDSSYPPGDLDGLDNDGNGKIDDVIGYNFRDNNWNPQHTDGNPSDYSHGTKVAGIAAAVTNNGKGVAGVAGGWGTQKGCSLMALRFIKDTDPFLDTQRTVDAINYAKDKGAKVINMSWYNPVGYVQAIEDAIRNAWNAGVVLVAAAGGDQTNALRWPAASSHVIAVAAVDQSDVLWSSSPWGMWVDVSAPGGGNWTTKYDVNQPNVHNLYHSGSAASIATPHVSGLAGLLFSYLGASTPRDRIVATIKYSTDDINGANNATQDYWGFMGTGRIDSYQALQMAQNTLVVPTQYATITAAMNAATSGKTVYVRPGTWTEDVTMKGGVKLIASRSDSTTINGLVNFNNISNAEVSGFTIAAPVMAVNVYNSPGITIRNCQLKGTSFGVSTNFASPVVRNNEVLNSTTTGIYLSTGAGTGVIAQNNRIEGNAKGIYAQSTPTLQNRHNSIKNNTTYDLQATSGSGYISAQRNWWGENPPNSGQIVTVNGIDYTNYLKGGHNYRPVSLYETLASVGEN